MFECQQSREFLKAVTSLGGAGGSALILIDDPDLVLVPAEFEGALPEGILEPGALLVGQGLVGAGLADVDDRQALEVKRLDEIGCIHEEPPERQW